MIGGCYELPIYSNNYNNVVCSYNICKTNSKPIIEKRNKKYYTTKTKTKM